MKKIMIFLAVTAMLGLAACESDKSEKPHDTAVSEPVEELPTEPVFMEYDQSDFTQINVAVNRQDGEPVMDVNTFNLEKVNYEKLISPCKLPENREKIKEESYRLAGFDIYERNEENGEFTTKFDEEGFNDFCDTPSEAFFEGFALCGDKVTVLADFDEVCNHSHCHKLIEYDLKTEEIRELYSYSSADEGEEITDITYLGGELYVIKEHEDNSADVCRVTDGKLEVLFTGNDVPDRNSQIPYLQFVKQQTDRLIVENNESYYAYSDNDKLFNEYSMIEYDDETGEVSELYHVEDEASTRKWVNFSAAVNGDDVLYTELDENGKTCIVGENFRINTGMRGLQLKSVNGSRLLAWVSDSTKTELYTYDLDKMECYVSNADGVNDVYLAGGNVIMLYGASNGRSLTLFIPDLGASFNLVRVISGRYYGYDGGRLWLADASSGWSGGTDENGNRTYFVKDGKAVGDLIIIGE